MYRQQISWIGICVFLLLDENSFTGDQPIVPECKYTNYFIDMWILLFIFAWQFAEDYPHIFHASKLLK